MADDLVVREWIEFEAEYGDIAPIDEPDDPHTVDEMIAEHNALVRAYLAVVAERDEAVRQRNESARYYEAARVSMNSAVALACEGALSGVDTKAQLAAMTAERDEFRSQLQCAEEMATVPEEIQRLEVQLAAERDTFRAQLTASEAAREKLRDGLNAILMKIGGRALSPDETLLREISGIIAQALSIAPGEPLPRMATSQEIKARYALAEPGKVGEP